jgi:hypothetical protein
LAEKKEENPNRERETTVHEEMLLVEVSQEILEYFGAL